MFQNLFRYELWCVSPSLPVKKKVGSEGNAHGLVVDVFLCPLSTSTGGGRERGADRCRSQPWERPSGRRLLQTRAHSSICRSHPVPGELSCGQPRAPSLGPCLMKPGPSET